MLGESGQNCRSSRKGAGATRGLVRNGSAISRLSPEGASADRESSWFEGPGERVCSWGDDLFGAGLEVPMCATSVQLWKDNKDESAARVAATAHTKLFNGRSVPVSRGFDAGMEDVDLHDMLGVLAETLDSGRCSPASDMSAAASHFGQLSEVALSVSSASDMTALDQAQDIDALPMLTFEFGEEPLDCEERLTQTWDRNWKPVSTANSPPDESDFATMIQHQAERIRLLETELVRSRSEVAALQRMLEKHLRGEISSTPNVRNPMTGAFSPITPAFVTTSEDGKSSYRAGTVHVSAHGTAPGMGKLVAPMPKPNEHISRAEHATSGDGTNGFIFADGLGTNLYDRRVLSGMVDAVVSRSSSARNLAMMDGGAQTAMIGSSDVERMNPNAALGGTDCGTESHNQFEFAPFHDGTFLFPSRQAAEACAAAREVFGPAAEALEKLNYRQQMAAAARHRSRRPQPRVCGSEGSLGMETESTGTSLFGDGSSLSALAKRRSKRADRRARPLGTTRYWADIEHELFLLGCKRFGPKNFAAIAGVVKSRSPKQVRTHLQKYQLKLLREARRMEKVDGGAALAQLRNVCDMAFTKAQLRALGADESQASQHSLRFVQNLERSCEPKRKLGKLAESPNSADDDDDDASSSLSPSSSSLTSSSLNESHSKSASLSTENATSPLRRDPETNESRVSSSSSDVAGDQVQPAEGNDADELDAK